MKKAVEKLTGPLKTLTLEGRPGGPSVVLFHGYGADASDLLPIADMAHVSKDVTWVFPEAPMEVIIAPGFYGKAWFQIDARRLENALKNGEPVDMSQSVPEGLAQAQKLAEQFYTALRKNHSKVIVGGFSQGAMLSTALFLATDQKPDGLVILSGSLINQKVWQSQLASVEGRTFFQSHGKNDALLGFEFAENLNNLLNAGGMHGDFVAFSGGHEIPPKVIERMGQYIQSTLKN